MTIDFKPYHLSSHPTESWRVQLCFAVVVGLFVTPSATGLSRDGVLPFIEPYSVERAMSDRVSISSVRLPSSRAPLRKHLPHEKLPPIRNQAQGRKTIPMDLDKRIRDPRPLSLQKAFEDLSPGPK